MNSVYACPGAFCRQLNKLIFKLPTHLQSTLTPTKSGVTNDTREPSVFLKGTTYENFHMESRYQTISLLLPHPLLILHRWSHRTWGLRTRISSLRPRMDHSYKALAYFPRPWPPIISAAHSVKNLQESFTQRAWLRCITNLTQIPIIVLAHPCTGISLSLTIPRRFHYKLTLYIVFIWRLVRCQY